MAGSQQLLLGEGAGGAEKVYIEDVFSTYLYTGTNTTQTITNGIDLAGKGGMCWFKIRNTATYDHALVDTVRGRAYTIASDLADAQYTSLANYDLASFDSNGFTVGPTDQFSAFNRSGSPIVSWTFRKQPKFFDIVTWTGNGANRSIPHSLASVPGCVMVKATSGTVRNWQVWHRGYGNNNYVTQLNATTAVANGGTTYWQNTAPDSSNIYIGSSTNVNASGVTYVAYVFAHDAGGFGLTGLDNVISCGSYTGNGSATGPTVTLGYEPQWLMIRRTDVANGWIMHDVMRGLPTGGNSIYLQANTNDAEAGPANYVDVNATGFQLKTTGNAWNASGGTYIYIAIRRGPMKVPTDGTTVYKSVASTGNGSAVTLTSSFPVDLSIDQQRTANGAGAIPYWQDRLRGGKAYFASTSTAAESTAASDLLLFDSNTTLVDKDWGSTTYTFVNHMFRRAPNFFDEVCYTGTGGSGNISHNLGVAPELMIVKARVYADGWYVYHKDVGNTKFLELELTATPTTYSTMWDNTTPTASVFTSTYLNYSARTHVAYLFATCAGVSKVGSYTGTGTTKQVDCGFAAGARFVLIKRTDSTGDWYVWDSARGIVSGNDPYVFVNTQAGEVTNTDYIDPYAAGFEISSTAPAAINANGGTFIYLAIA